MNRSSAGVVELRDLTDSPELDGLSVLHMVSERSPVRDLALVTDFEDIGAVGPDTVVLLSPGGARGGWMISAALRYAWERRVCALIAPEQSFTASVVELAKRFEVSLLTTSRDMTRLAIDAAIRIGTARAESAVRVRAVVDRLSRASDVAQAIAVLSDELDGAEVWIESAGTRTFGSHSSATGAGIDAPRPTTELRAALSAHDAGAGAIRARVPRPATAFGEQLLAEAAPSIRALLFEQQLAAMRASLPAIAITALTGSATIAAFHEPMLPGLDESNDLPLDGDFVAVCLLTDDPERLGALVHQLWFLAFPTSLLARFEGGWVGFLPAENDAGVSEDLERIRQGFGRTAGHPLSGGCSRVHRSRAEVRAAVREAWLAARLADPGSAVSESQAFVEFDRISARLLGRLMPVDLAEQLVEVLFPRLVADASAGRTIDAVLAYLDARGSVSAAADRLGLHRNTLQTRLKHAEELGLELSDPSDVLPTHLLLAAVRREPNGRSRSTDPRSPDVRSSDL